MTTPKNVEPVVKTLKAICERTEAAMKLFPSDTPGIARELTENMRHVILSVIKRFENETTEAKFVAECNSYFKLTPSNEDSKETIPLVSAESQFTPTPAAAATTPSPVPASTSYEGTIIEAFVSRVTLVTMSTTEIDSLDKIPRKIKPYRGYQDRRDPRELLAQVERLVNYWTDGATNREMIYLVLTSCNPQIRDNFKKQGFQDYHTFIGFFISAFSPSQFWDGKLIYKLGSSSSLEMLVDRMGLLHYTITNFTLKDVYDYIGSRLYSAEHFELKGWVGEWGTLPLHEAYKHIIAHVVKRSKTWPPKNVLR